MRQQIVSVSALVIGLCAGGAIAQDDPDYGFDFVTIGDPGNRDTNDLEVPGIFGEGGYRIGGVDYEYRMATTEVTLGQYFEFVVAYQPYYEQRTGNTWGLIDFTGFGIHTSDGSASILLGYSLNRAATMGWEYAARYVNWLHNGKVIEEWAFESGVYDTSTFYRDSDEVAHHQAFHDPDARYWIPTKDEWVKAAYWDPSKDSGAGGYWKYPNGSDNESIPQLLPSEGGERNAGSFVVGWPLDVASFVDVTSPWGMFDMAGGESELLEEVTPTGRLDRRGLASSDYHYGEFGDIASRDIINPGPYTHVGDPYGLRIVSALYHSADLNQDWYVNFYDISVFIRRFMANDLLVDFNEDGRLDVEDVVLFVSIFAK